MATMKSIVAPTNACSSCISLVEPDRWSGADLRSTISTSLGFSSMGVRSHLMPQQSIVLHRLLRKYERQYPRHADTLAMTESSHAPFLSMKSGWSFTHSMGQETIVSFYVQDIFSAEGHISKTMHTCASPLVGVMAELSKPMTAMLHPLLS